MRLNYLNYAVPSAIALLGLVLAGKAQAGVMQVSPLSIELGSAVSSATETLENKGTTVLNVQTRVYKWSRKDGKDVLEPTADVIASPPAFKIQPGAKATVRVVRLSKTPLKAEESYRLLIDDIPPPPDKPGDNVAFAVRHAIPVFFQAPGIKTGLAWTATVQGNEIDLHATNSGQLHSKLSQMSVTSNGVVVGTFEGLAGYVLGNADAHFKLKLKGPVSGKSITLKATANDGPVNTTVTLQ